MVDGNNLNPVPSYTVNDSVALKEHLSQVHIANLRNDTTRQGELFQTVGSAECPLRKYLSYAGRVAGDVEADSVQIFEGLRRPDYRSQRAIRLRASSCVMPSPPSACSIPRRTL